MELGVLCRVLCQILQTVQTTRSVSHIRVRPSPPRKYHPLGKMFAASQLLEATTPVIIAVRSPSILDAFNGLNYGGTVDSGGTFEG